MMGTDRLEVLTDAGKIVVEDSRVATVHRLKKPMQECSTTMNAAAIQRLVRQDRTGASTAPRLISVHSPHGTDHGAVLEYFARAILYDQPLLAPAGEAGPAPGVMLTGAPGWWPPHGFTRGMASDRCLRSLRISSRR